MKRKKFNVVFSSKAETEIKDSYDYYYQKSEVLADLFYNKIIQTVEKIKLTPSGFVKYKNFRKVPVDKFPFVIFYTIIMDSIFVVSVFNTNQNPNKYPK